MFDNCFKEYSEEDYYAKDPVTGEIYATTPEYDTFSTMCWVIGSAFIAMALLQSILYFSF